MNKLAGQNGVGHVPMFADQKCVLGQRGGAMIAQVVALGAGTNDHQTSAEIVTQAVGFLFEAVHILQKEIWSWKPATGAGHRP